MIRTMCEIRSSIGAVRIMTLRATSRGKDIQLKVQHKSLNKQNEYK